LGRTTKLIPLVRAGWAQAVGRNGYPHVSRSEVFLHASVRVNVVASGLTEEELYTGPSEDLFNAIRFGD